MASALRDGGIKRRTQLIGAKFSYRMPDYFFGCRERAGGDFRFHPLCDIVVKLYFHERASFSPPIQPRFLRFGIA
jgi:hypothetical protein